VITLAGGWIRIQRQIQSHWLWEDKPVSKGQAWIDLILMANHEDSKFLLGNQLIEAKKGDVITSEVKLMKRWGWSKSKVRAFLLLLENDSMIVKKADTKKTTLNLVNYGVWQDSQTAKELVKDRKQTTKEPLSDTINNLYNSNNNNHLNKGIYKSPSNKFADDSIELTLASELYNLMLENNQNVKKPNLQVWAKDIHKMIELDERTVEGIRSVINWSQRDTFWRGNILSTSALRKQFDKLTIQMDTRGGQAQHKQIPRAFSSLQEWANEE